MSEIHSSIYRRIKINKILRKVSKIAGYSIEAIIYLFLILMIISGSKPVTSYKQSIVPYKLVLVASGSMIPTMEIHSIAVLEYCDTSEVEVGDIVVYWDDNKQYSIVHRIIEETTNDNGETGYIVQGDNNPIPDNTIIDNSNILGKIVYINNDIVPLMDYLVSGNQISILRAIIVGIGLAILFKIAIIVLYCLWILVKTLAFLCKYKGNLVGIKDRYEKLVFKSKMICNTDKKDIEQLEISLKKIEDTSKLLNIAIMAMMVATLEVSVYECLVDLNKDSSNKNIISYRNKIAGRLNIYAKIINIIHRN